MEDFGAIYKILKALDSGLDDDELDQEAIGPEALGVSENVHMGRAVAQQ